MKEENKPYIECKRHGNTWSDFNRVCPECLREHIKNKKQSTPLLSSEGLKKE